MTWRAHLQLHYTQEGARCVGRSTHVGPLRVLKSLHPEGPGICHHVLLHPPGGVVAGDELLCTAHLQPGSHAVITTPGATRFYRSEGAPALQQVALHVAAGARLEWLPMENIAHRGCMAENRLALHLQPGAQALAWDTLVLGLPASGEAFDTPAALARHGHFQQHMEVPGQWLERGLLRASDATLLHGPLGLAGQPVVATLGFFSGSPLGAAQREALLEAARSCIAASPLHPRAGATAPQPGVVLLRVLGAKVEPVMALLAQVRAAWRQQAWGLGAQPPRIWAT